MQQFSPQPTLARWPSLGHVFENRHGQTGAAQVCGRMANSSQSQVSSQISTEKKSGLFGMSDSSINMVSGGLAGCVGKTLTAPLSRLTILYQVGPALSGGHGQGVAPGNSLASLGKECRRVMVEEGFFAFWKGNLASVLHRFPYSAINFSVYESTRSAFKHMGYDENLPIRLVSGAAGGAVACAAAYPLDIVRTRLSVERENTVAKRKGVMNSRILEIISSILREEGPRGLYRGLFVSMSVAVPNLAIGFGVYGTMKEHMLLKEKSGRFRRYNSDGEASLNAPGAMLSGAVGGSISSVIVFPLDVVRRRMQVLSISSSYGKDAGAIALIRQIWRAEGTAGIYRGIIPELLKVTPMVGITFCAYEVSSAFFRKF